MMYYIIGYVVIAVLSYGMVFAMWQRSFHPIAGEMYKMDMVHSILVGIFWPFLLPISIASFYTKDGKVFYGLKFY